MDVDMWLVYRAFVIERHKIWERRQAGEPGPWSLDPILAGHKFTNVFRVLDPGSQFVLMDLFPDVSGPDALLRAVLYRHTNHPDVWRGLADYWGGYPVLSAGQPQLRAELSSVLNAMKNSGQLVFNPAYLIYPGHVKGANKVDTILDRCFGFAAEMGETFAGASLTLEEKVGILRGYPGIGDFIAMQVSTDWNYGRWGRDEENDFILAGPGARRGAKHVFPSRKPEDAIREARKLWLEDPDAPMLGERPLSLMDVQNTMCEFSKYARYLGQAPGRAYEPAHPGPQEPPVLPQHWTTKGTSK